MAIIGVIVIGKYIDACCAITSVERLLRETLVRARQPAKNRFGARIGSVNCVCGSLEKLSIVFTIRVWVPVVDIRFIPNFVILNASAEMIDHPRYIFRKRSDLLVRFRRPEQRIETSIGIVKAADRK